MKRILLAAAVVAAFVTLGASSAAADSSTYTYERVPWLGAIIQVAPDGTTTQLSYSQWQQLGFPTFTDAPTEYMKYSWSSFIYARTTVTASDVVQDQIGYGQWANVGFPSPTTVAWIPGSSVVAWANSPVLFLHEPYGDYHALSYGEWQAAGFPSYTRSTNEGFYHLSWSGTPDIAFICDWAGGHGVPLTYQEWLAAGAPSPIQVESIPNAIFYKSHVNELVWYLNPIDGGDALSYQQWQAFGAPPPTYDDSGLQYQETCVNYGNVPGRDNALIP
ncbi:hypothetical protein GCM10027414_06380 [Humibacter ginsengiterrae]